MPTLKGERGMKNRTGFLLVLAALVASVAVDDGLARKAAAQFPGGDIGAQRAPAIDIDRNDSLYLFMSAATSPNTTPHSQIFFTISSDGGATFDNLPKTLNLSNSPGEAFGPSAAVTKAGKPKVFVVYHDDSSGVTQAQMIFSKKRTNFRDPVSLGSGNIGSFSPRVALASTGTVNVVWGDTANGGRHVTFVHYSSFDFSFGAPITISRNSDGAFNPEIAIDSSDAINVVWEDTAVGAGAIMFARSTNGGVTFSVPAPVSRGPGRATEAHIASDGTNGLHVTWVDDSAGGNQAFYSRSTNGGASFSIPLNVTASPGADIHKPVLATYSDRVFLAYQDDAGSNQQVFLARSSDRGLTFSRPAQVSHADNRRGRGHSPAMVFDSQGKLHIVWIDSSILGREEGILFYSNSPDGQSFSGQKMILAAL